MSSRIIISALLQLWLLPWHWVSKW